jgi:RNA polymerase sigma-70 factor (ECF subfamily)
MVDGSCLVPGLRVLLGAAAFEWVRATTGALYPDRRDEVQEVLSRDREDVRRTHEGDPEAYRRLIERHQDYVARILWRFSRDRGVHEELVQDVFVEAFLSLSGYSGQAPLDHWLARIATRVGYRHWKEKARRREAGPLDADPWAEVAGDGDVAAALEPDEAAALLYRILAQMSPRDRLVLTLRYLEQCDVVETARRTGWSKTMVKVQTLRARNRLRKLIEQNGTELLQ